MSFCHSFIELLLLLPLLLPVERALATASIADEVHSQPLVRKRIRRLQQSPGLHLEKMLNGHGKSFTSRALSSSVQKSDKEMRIFWADTPLEQRIADLPRPMTTETMAKFFEEEKKFSLQQTAADADSSVVKETQVVYLDFVTNVGGTYNVSVNGTDNTVTTKTYPVREYTVEEKKAIIRGIREDYQAFDIVFVDKEPTSGSYSTVKFNEALPIRVRTDGKTIQGIFEAPFGIADGIDFLNLNPSDNVVVGVNIIDYFIRFDPTGGEFTRLTGVQIVNGDVAAAVSQTIINTSVRTGSHEFGHIAGLRHRNSLGAIGDGLPVTGLTLPRGDQSNPTYNGPQEATETAFHIIATTPFGGIGTFESFKPTAFLSERSAIKLTLAFGDGENIISEEQAAALSHDKTGLEIPRLVIPNTIEVGENKGKGFLNTNAMVIVGSLRESEEVDTFRLQLKQHKILNVEVISTFDSTNVDKVDTSVTLRGPNGGTLLNLRNDNEFEATLGDNVLLDVTVPETGTYELTVSDSPMAAALGMTGNYKVLIYVVDDPIEKVKDREGEKPMSFYYSIDLDPVDAGFRKLGHEIFEMNEGLDKEVGSGAEKGNGAESKRGRLRG